MPRPTFSLRFTHEGLRDLVRIVAERDGISQNELLEQAAEHEVVVRGGLLATELEAAAAHLRTITAPSAAELIKQSVASFVEAEALPDPLRPRQFTRSPDESADNEPELGAVAAFGRR